MHFEDGRTFLNLLCLVNEALRKIAVIDLGFAKTVWTFEGGQIGRTFLSKEAE